MSVQFNWQEHPKSSITPPTIPAWEVGKREVEGSERVLCPVDQPGGHPIVTHEEDPIPLVGGSTIQELNRVTTEAGDGVPFVRLGKPFARDCGHKIPLDVGVAAEPDLLALSSMLTERSYQGGDVLNAAIAISHRCPRMGTLHENDRKRILLCGGGPEGPRVSGRKQHTPNLCSLVAGCLMPAYTKAEQARRKGGAKPPARRRKPMRRRSLTNARAVAWRTEYLPLRAAFLEVNAWCELLVAGICTGRATEIQHRVQTSLDPSIENLLDVNFWLASCHQCNTWSGTHPTEAQALGIEIRPQVRDAIRATLGDAQEAPAHDR